MGDNTPRLLTVAVTSRALFDLEEGHALFEAEGVDAYAEYQRKHEDDVLRPAWHSRWYASCWRSTRASRRSRRGWK